MAFLTHLAAMLFAPHPTQIERSCCCCCDENSSTEVHQSIDITTLLTIPACDLTPQSHHRSLAMISLYFLQRRASRLDSRCIQRALTFIVVKQRPFSSAVYHPQKGADLICIYNDLGDTATPFSLSLPLSILGERARKPTIREEGSFTPDADQDELSS